MKILLVGQPNVGKSCLLNALVGPKVAVSNYPGTTVEVTRAEKVFNHTKIEFEDTPGIYSISDRSEEEKITERALFEEKPDGVIVIADATSLGRNLYLALQVLEAQIPIILALNFIEDAEKKGIKINCRKLEKLLNVPVILINPLTGEGVNKLVREVLKIEKIKGKVFTPHLLTPKGTGFTVRYDDDIERAIDKISFKLKDYYPPPALQIPPSHPKTVLPKRFVALRILEGDTDFYHYLRDEKAIKEAKKDLSINHPEVSKDISITRYGIASFIARKITKIIPLREKRRDLQKQVDKILLDKIWGPILTILFFLVIFGGLLVLGNLIQGALMDLTENLLPSSYARGTSPAAIILGQALYGMAAGISIALPYVFLFYLILGFTEDIGLLPRFIVNLERFLRKLNLPGKSLIPLMLGLGCTVPAIRSTRILSCRREKFCTASFFTCVPCSSRIAIIMGVVGYFGGMFLALAVFTTLFISFFIWSFLIKKIMRPKVSPLLLELPPYRKPLIKNIAIKSWLRMKDFVYIVIPLLAIGGAVYAILDISGITNSIVKPLSPITWWLGLPAITIIPLVFGFLQKDLTGPMLLSVLGAEIALVLSPLQIYTFGIAATIQIPCIIALGMLIREFGAKKAILLTIASMIYGLLFAGLLWRLISIF
jgi:ferrous iron transport protein B